MLFKDNFVHCDLHAGNVFVKTTTTTTTITSPGKEQLERERITTQHYTIIFLDAGIATSLSPQGQANLRDLFRAVVLNDGETAGRLMVERARYERCSQIEGGVEAFSKGISDIVAEFHDHRKKKGLTLGAVRIGELLGKVSHYSYPQHCYLSFRILLVSYDHPQKQFPPLFFS
jgi:aarF domain-containing kinase